MPAWEREMSPSQRATSPSPSYRAPNKQLASNQKAQQLHVRTSSSAVTGGPYHFLCLMYFHRRFTTHFPVCVQKTIEIVHGFSNSDHVTCTWVLSALLLCSSFLRPQWLFGIQSMAINRMAHHYVHVSVSSLRQTTKPSSLHQGWLIMSIKWTQIATSSGNTRSEVTNGNNS